MTLDRQMPDALPKALRVVDRPGSRAVDRWLIRATGFSFLSSYAAWLRHDPLLSTLLLTTVGRRSGLLHTVPLSYTCCDGSIVVLGSNAARPQDPAWVHNLRADPRCWVRARRRDQPARARILVGDERQRVLETTMGDRPHALVYEQRIAALGRMLPIVVLDCPADNRSLHIHKRK